MGLLGDAMRLDKSIIAEVAAPQAALEAVPEATSLTTDGSGSCHSAPGAVPEATPRAAPEATEVSVDPATEAATADEKETGEGLEMSDEDRGAEEVAHPSTSNK